MSRLSGFSDKEIYVLTEQISLSAYEIHRNNRFTKEFKDIHESLRKEINKEESLRFEKTGSTNFSDSYGLQNSPSEW